MNSTLNMSAVSSSQLIRMRSEDESIKSTRTVAWFSQSYKSAATTLEECVKDLITEPSLREAYVARVREHIVQTVGVRAAIEQFGLTPLEAECIIIYTLEASDVVEGRSSSDSFYRKFNQILYKRSEGGITQLADYVYHVRKGLEKVPSVCSPGQTATLYRGIDCCVTSCSAQYKQGEQVVWTAFSSCTQNKAVMPDFGKGTRFLLQVERGLACPPLVRLNLVPLFMLHNMNCDAIRCKVSHDQFLPKP